MTKKVAIAASFVAFCSGLLYASDPTERELERPRQASLAIIHHMPIDITGLIFKEVSKVTNPHYLTVVCKNWFNIIRERKDPEQGLTFSGLNPFLKDCIKIWWGNEGSVTNLGQFYNGQLVYGRGTPEEKMTLFSSLKDPFKGTFDLSAFFGNAVNSLVITTDVERFFKVEEENKNKTVILSVFRQQVEQESKKDPNHSLAKFLAGWDKKVKVGLFYKRGENNLTGIDYLTTATTSEISSRNLYDNWGAARSCGSDGVHRVLFVQSSARSAAQSAQFSCLFFEPK